MSRMPGRNRTPVIRMTAAATVLALAGGAAAVPLGPVGGIAQAQVAPIPQEGVSHGAVRQTFGANPDWEASVFFSGAMTAHTVAIDFVPQKSGQSALERPEQAPKDDPVFNIIPETATYTVKHYKQVNRRTVEAGTYEVTGRTSQVTTPTGNYAIRIAYDLPGVAVEKSDRLALFATGLGTTYPKPLARGDIRFTMPHVNSGFGGTIRVHNPDSDEVGLPQLLVEQGTASTEVPVAKDGTYQLTINDASGTYTAKVVPPAGFATPEPRTWDVDSDAPDRDFDVYPITVSGTLLDASETPVQGATVMIAGREATTDQQGNFTVVRVPAGTYDVLFGATSTTEPKSFSGVVVSDRRDNVIGQFHVDEKPQVGTVSGKVIDPDGHGVADVTVTAGGKTGTTGADGRYSIEDVPTGETTIEVPAAPARYVRPMPQKVNVTDSGVSGVDFTLNLKSTPTPTPMPKPTPPTTPSTTTPKPSPTPKPSSTPKPTPRTTTPTPKPTPRTTTRTTPSTQPQAPTVGSVAGKVTDPAGKAVPGATVTARDPNGKAYTVQVAKDGTFRLDSLPPGRYTITVGVPSGHVAPPPANVLVKAGVTAQLPGFVVNPEKPKARFDWDRMVVKPGETQVTAPKRSGDTTFVPSFRNSGVTQVSPDGTTTQLPAEDRWISVEKDGTVVARPPRDAAPGEYRVEVADAAGDTHVITVEVTEPAPMSSQYAVRFPVIPVPAGTSRQAGRPRATVTDGPFTYADRRLPEGTRFAVDSKHRGWVRVDATGRLTFTPLRNTKPGIRTIPVKVTFPDGSSRTYNAEVEIGDPLLASTTALGFEDGLSVRPGEAVTVMRTGATALPEGTTFEVDRTELLGGWVAVVDERNGNLRVFAPQQGEAVEVPVVAYFSDGSSTRLTAGVRLSTSSALSAAHNPSYASVKAEPGSTATVALSGTVPEGTAFDVVDGGGLREVGVDRHSGTLAVELPADAQLDSPYTVTVRVRYGDGSTEEITAKITAVSEAVRFSPRVSGSLAEIGDSVVVRTGLPSGAKLVGFNHDGWNVDYNSDTGELTVAPSTDVPHGSVIKVPLEVRFSDGSTAVVEYPVTATGKGAPAKTGGSSENGGWIAVVLGALAALAGLGFAVYLNQDAINALLKQYGF